VAETKKRERHKVGKEECEKNKLTLMQKNKNEDNRDQLKVEELRKRNGRIKRKINVGKVIQEESETLHSDV